MSLILPPLPLLSPPPANPSPSTNSSDTSPPPSAPPPSPPQESPPVVSSPPPSPAVVSSPPPAVVSSPPPTVVSSPPPPVTNSPPPSSPVVISSPPPQPSPSTPAATPPTPSPPAESPLTAKPSPSNPAATPPPSNPADTPPPSTPAVKPPPVTSTPPPASIPANPSPPVPPTPLPEIPKEKPTARPTGPSTNDRNSALAASSSSSSSNVSPGGAVAIGIVVGLVLLSLLLLGVWFTRRRKRKDTGTFIGYTMPSAYASPQGSDIVLLNSHSSAPKMRSNSGSDYMYSPSESAGVVNNQRSVFSYDELSQSTNGFSEKNLLGEGGFGCVYKGVLGDGRDIAVKQLKIGGSQGEREFRAEVEIISRVHHRHLVTLVGYCISEQHRLLVYDYVPNNTLHFHLHGTNLTSLKHILMLI